MDQQACGLDVLLSGHEDQDVAGRLLQMHLDGLFDRSIQVIIYRRLFVHSLYWKSPARYEIHRCPSKKFRELVRIHSRRGDYDSHISPTKGHILDYPEKYIGIETPLMRLIHDDNTVLLKVRVIKALPKQHAISHILDLRASTSTVLEPDRISNPIPQLSLQLLSYSLGHRHCGYPARLGAADDHAAVAVACLEHVLGELRGLAGAGLAYYDHYFVLAD